MTLTFQIWLHRGMNIKQIQLGKRKCTQTELLEGKP